MIHPEGGLQLTAYVDPIVQLPDEGTELVKFSSINITTWWNYEAVLPRGVRFHLHWQHCTRSISRRCGPEAAIDSWGSDPTNNVAGFCPLFIQNAIKSRLIFQQNSYNSYPLGSLCADHSQ